LKFLLCITEAQRAGIYWNYKHDAISIKKDNPHGSSNDTLMSGKQQKEVKSEKAHPCLSKFPKGLS
jgi:hypothetical protein